MAAINPGAAPAPAPGAGAPPPGGAPPPAAGGTPAPQNDPFGFAQHIAQAPEHLRQPLQTALDAVAPQLTQRLSTYQPLDPFMEQLSPLLQPVNDQGQPDPNGQPQIAGLLSLYGLLTEGTPEAEQALEQWWESVGQEFGFLDPDDDEPGGQGAAAAPDAGAAADLSALDPGAQAVVQQLMEQNQRLEARLGEFETRQQTTEQQNAVNAAAEAIRTELTTLMQQNGIDGADNLNSPNAQDILRLAGGYGSDPQAIPKAVEDWKRMTGTAATQQVTDAGQQLSGVDALRNALMTGQQEPQVGHALGRGQQSSSPEPVRSFDQARDLAMQRMRESFQT